MVIPLGNITFTREQVQAIWNEGLKTVATDLEAMGLPPQPNPGVYVRDFRTRPDGSFFSDEESQLLLRRMANRLTVMAGSPSQNFREMDQELSQTFHHSFRGSQ